MDVTRSHSTPADPWRECWAGQRSLTLWLLLMWTFSSFGVAWFAPQLSAINFFGWPLSFYMAAQGSPLLFILLIGVYARAAGAIERRQGFSEEHD